MTSDNTQDIWVIFTSWGTLSFFFDLWTQTWESRILVHPFQTNLPKEQSFHLQENWKKFNKGQTFFVQCYENKPSKSSYYHQQKKNNIFISWKIERSIEVKTFLHRIMKTSPVKKSIKINIYLIITRVRPNIGFSKFSRSQTFQN